MVTFIEERKKQKRLILVFVGTLLITILILWWGYFRKEKVTFPKGEGEAIPPTKIEINFEIMEKLRNLKLSPFEEIKTFEGETGRKNPFLPY